MINETNDTTAYCPFTTVAGVTEQLQVTFCLLPPPHISYFCVSYTSGERTLFIREPRILATQGNLALICVKQGINPIARYTDYNFFVYHAPIHGHGIPTLQLIPHPKPDFFPWDKDCYFTRGEVGFLPYCTSSGSKQQSPFTPPTPTISLTHALALARRHKPPFTTHINKEELDAFKVVTIYTRFEDSGITHYDLFVYDSKANWTCESTTSSEELPRNFTSDRVITVSGTMVWVDLSQGMFLCDLLEEITGGPRQVRYIQLPKPVQSRHDYPLSVSTSAFSRDIALVDDRIKFVDLEIHNTSPGLYCWTAVTWSMSVGDSQFQKDAEVKSADIASSDALDLRSLFVAHPSLSSHHGDILYLMAKPVIALDDPGSTVLAVHMKNKTVERVTKYTTQRTGSMDFAYMLTTISKFLAPPSDSKANIRKRWSASLGGTSCRKARRKSPAFTLKSGLVQMEEDDHSKKPPAMDDHGDNMDLR